MTEAQDVNSWSVEEIDQLICLVRSNDVLYNQALPGYANREVTEKLWSNIAARVNKTSQATVKKWQVLRAGYRKRRKDYLPGPSGSASVKKKKWAYFDSLEFLERYLEDRKSTTNVPEETLDIVDSQISSPLDTDSGSRCHSRTYTLGEDGVLQLMETEENAEEQINEPSVSDMEPVNQTEQKKGKRKVKNAREMADVQMAEYISILKEKHSKKDKKSSMEYFFLSLTDEAEALSPQQQTVFKIRVLELLHELGNK